MSDTKKRFVSSDELAAAMVAPDNLSVIRAAKKRWGRLLAPDDMDSAAMLATWRALQSHRQGYGQKFTTSLYRFLEWAFQDEARKQRRQLARLTYCSSLPGRPSPEDRVAEGLAHLGEVIELVDDPDVRDLLRRRHLEGHSVSRIGADLGMAKETIRKRLKRAALALGEALAQDQQTSAP